MNQLTKSILPGFTREVIQTPLGRTHFQSNARTSVGMWKSRAEDIRKFPITVPPLKIQQEIADMVKDRRKRIAEERKAIETRKNHAIRDVEEMILGRESFSRKSNLLEVSGWESTAKIATKSSRLSPT